MSDINVEKATASEFHAQKAPYSSVSNKTVELITNPDALAIWTYLQTRTPGWRVIGSHLQDHFGMGRVRYRKAMKHLTDLRLITHAPVRDEAGRMAGTRVIVHYQPRGTEPAHSESPRVQVSECSESASLAETTPYVIKESFNKQSEGDVINNTHGPSNDGPPKKRRPRTSYPDEFEEAWKLYPKREGSNPKREACSSWNARLREGVAAAEMTDGVRRYAAFCAAKGKLGPEHVMQGRRFFGPSREYENDWTVNRTAPHRTNQRPTARHHGFTATAEGFTSSDGGLTFDL